jgi:hypothetical protein
MHNYKALKAVGKVSVRKQEKVNEVLNEDGSVKIHESAEELQVVCKKYDPDTGEVQDDRVSVYHLRDVKREIDRRKSEIARIQAEQAEWEQLETDLKAL